MLRHWGVFRSTLRPPSIWESSCSRSYSSKKPTLLSGSNSTNTSTSLSGRKSGRRTDPKNASFRIRWRRQNCPSLALGITKSIDIAVIVSPLAGPRKPLGPPRSPWLSLLPRWSFRQEFFEFGDERGFVVAGESVVEEARDALAEKPFPRRIFAARVDGEKKPPIGGRGGEVARSVADHQHTMFRVLFACRQLQVGFFRAHFLAG